MINSCLIYCSLLFFIVLYCSLLFFIVLFLDVVLRCAPFNNLLLLLIAIFGLQYRLSLMSNHPLLESFFIYPEVPNFSMAEWWRYDDFCLPFHCSGCGIIERNQQAMDMDRRFVHDASRY